MTSPSTMTDAIRNGVLYQLLNVHTAFPGKILSFDFIKRSASIQPQINKSYTDGTIQPLPILNNVPIIFPFASGSSISFPINAGDYCLVVSCERAIDYWLTTGIQSAPEDPRKFDLSDSVAIMGLLPFSDSNPLPNNTDFRISYKGSNILIDQNGNVKIETSNTVAIGNSTTEVLDIISRLINILETSLTTAPTTPIQQVPIPPT